VCVVCVCGERDAVRVWSCASVWCVCVVCVCGLRVWCVCVCVRVGGKPLVRAWHAFAPGPCSLPGPYLPTNLPTYCNRCLPIAGRPHSPLPLPLPAHAPTRAQDELRELLARQQEQYKKLQMERARQQASKTKAPQKPKAAGAATAATATAGAKAAGGGGAAAAATMATRPAGAGPAGAGKIPRRPSLQNAKGAATAATTTTASPSLPSGGGGDAQAFEQVVTHTSSIKGPMKITRAGKVRVVLRCPALGMAWRCSRRS